MAASQNDYNVDVDIARQAAERWRDREAKRQNKVQAFQEGQLDAVEPKERLAMRANRLISQIQEQMAKAPVAVPARLQELAERGRIAPDQVDNLMMERIIGDSRDFLSIAFLDSAAATSRSVGRVNIVLGEGRAGFGTGFLVTPQLLMTNEHVLESADVASNSFVEFDYQLDRFGQPAAVERFALQPDRFFLNNRELDYALVAVASASRRGRALADFGFCPLIATEGKITLGEPVNIIQHPRGEMKQIVMRENRLLDLLELHLHYESDTEPGSSGSPVFNDQWEIVGLHHSGVPAIDDNGNLLNIHGDIWRRGDDPALIKWVGNEGIRASRLVAHIRSVPASEIVGSQKELRDELLGQSQTNSPPVIREAGEHRGGLVSTNGSGINRPLQQVSIAGVTGNGTVSLSIPLHIVVSLGAPTSLATAVTSDTNPAVDEPVEEIAIDPDYRNRSGYDPQFLGFEVPLPRPGNAIRSQVFRYGDSTGQETSELKYYHYSILFNRKRCLAFVAAVNIEINPRFKHRRTGKDRWFMDPRVPEEFQAGEELYANNPIDRGHLVRRDDAAWGQTKEEARQASDDTFHFTNCSPQHEIYNQSGLASSQGQLLWGNLENHIAKEAKANNKRLSVFNGPVFRKNDRKIVGIQVPKEYFKVVVFEADDGRPRALAFVLSQAGLIKDLPAEDFEVGPYRPYQISLSELESRTKLKFGKLNQYDPLQSTEVDELFELDSEAIAIDRLEDIVIGTKAPVKQTSPS